MSVNKPNTWTLQHINNKLTAMTPNQMISTDIPCGDWNRRIRTDIYKKDDTIAIVEIVISEDREEDYVLHSFILTDKENTGHHYQNETFDQIYADVWATEIRNNPMLRFYLNEAAYHPPVSVNETDITKLTDTYSAEKIADVFLDTATLGEIKSLLNLDDDALFSVHLHDVKKIARLCILEDTNLVYDCANKLLSKQIPIQ